MYSIAYKRYVTALLLVVYIFNQTDRAIFGFLMEPIKAELQLSDTQLGMLAGPALVVVYALLGVPIARLADRSSRVNIIAIAVAAWSAIVTTSALVQTFLQFAFARIGVGIGEAGFSAIAQSLLADYHQAHERTRALSVFLLAIPLGGVLSSLMAGWINETYGWRAAFVAAGLPGIFLALQVKLTVREPPRQVSPSQTAIQPQMSSIFAMIWAQPSLRHMAIATALVNIVCFSVLVWTSAFFIRVHGMRTGELGMWLALMVGFGGGLGTWLGGYVTHRYGRGDERSQVRIIACTTVLMVPLLALALWSSSKHVALLLLVPAHAMMFFFFGPTFALILSLAPASTRATMTAVFILIQMLAGGVLGVQLVGIISDALVAPAGNTAQALRWSLTLICSLALWAAVHFWLTGRTIRQDVQG